jgi:hypothetical protein
MNQALYAHINNKRKMKKEKKNSLPRKKKSFSEIKLFSYEFSRWM